MSVCDARVGGYECVRRCVCIGVRGRSQMSFPRCHPLRLLVQDLLLGLELADEARLAGQQQDPEICLSPIPPCCDFKYQLPHPAFLPMGFKLYPHACIARSLLAYPPAPRTHFIGDFTWIPGLPAENWVLKQTFQKVLAGDGNYNLIERMGQPGCSGSPFPQ